MKHLLVTVTSMLALAVASIAGESGWLDDFEAAKKQAAAENKTILINFTGSDWCGWCIKLEKEVFLKKEFKDFAKDHLVLMEADFPDKKKLSAEVTAQNKKLDKEYKVEGYPTLYLLDAEGKKLTDDIGYRAGGAQAYVDHLKTLLKK
jgi:protein disulfide-isomerase